MIRPAEDLALYRADMARWEHAERGTCPTFCSGTAWMNSPFRN